MAFEVVVKRANKVLATQAVASLLVTKVQEVFGLETGIQVFEVKKTYDGNTAVAKEVGTITTLVAEYPPKPTQP